MDKETVKELIRSYIIFLNKNQINIQKAYLFGSYARGNFYEDSDIDIALVLKNLENSFLMQIELMKLGRKLDSRIEPHPFDEKDFKAGLNPFIQEILNTGIEIV